MADNNRISRMFGNTDRSFYTQADYGHTSDGKLFDLWSSGPDGKQRYYMMNVYLDDHMIRIINNSDNFSLHRISANDEVRREFDKQRDESPEAYVEHLKKEAEPYVKDMKRSIERLESFAPETPEAFKSRAKIGDVTKGVANADIANYVGVLSGTTHDGHKYDFWNDFEKPTSYHMEIKMPSGKLRLSYSTGTGSISTAFIPAKTGRPLTEKEKRDATNSTRWLDDVIKTKASKYMREMNMLIDKVGGFGPEKK